MFLRIALFALMALGLAGFGTVAYISTRPPPQAQATEAPPVKVKLLTAAKPLRAGSLLKPADVDAADFDQRQTPPGAWTDTPANRSLLLGAMVRRSLVAGDPLLPGDIMRPGDHGFLAAVLAPGMRAVTVGVDAISGSAGLIWPGDRVDLILTQTLDPNTSTAGHRIASETVLSNVRVIAIDQQLIQGGTPDGTEPKTARTATLEVTGPQAEAVTVAAKLGPLSLVVRSADTADTVADAATGARLAPQVAAGPPAAKAAATPVITWASDVSPALDANAHHSEPTVNTMKVFTGASDGKEFHFP